MRGTALGGHSKQTIEDGRERETTQASIAATDNYKAGEATADFTIQIAMPEPDFVTPRGLKVIGPQAFEGIAAKSVRIGDSVTVLRSQAFANCPKLKRIYIPGTVQEIPDDLLKGCKSVTVYGSSKVAKAFAEKNGFKFVEVK